MLTAICKNDYERILRAQKHLTANPNFRKSVYLDRIEDRMLEPEEIKGLNYFEVYGVFFDRKISELLKESVPCSSRIVYLNEKPENIKSGTYEVRVADKPAWLYFWWAQGYPRGVIVLADNEDINIKAAEIAEGEPWDWSQMIDI